MAQITIDVPDDLLPRLEPLQRQLSTLVVAWLNQAEVTPVSSTAIAYQEVLDFLMTRPTAADILQFKVSAVAQDRLRELLDRNRNQNLTHDEIAELNSYEQIDHLMRLLKIRSHTAENTPIATVHG
jgi:hypothetical protein